MRLDWMDRRRRLGRPERPVREVILFLATQSSSRAVRESRFCSSRMRLEPSSRLRTLVRPERPSILEILLATK